MNKDEKNDEIFDEYRKFVTFLSKNEINLKFPNSSSKHAAVVLANILESSKEVYIYDNHLKGDIAYSHPDFIYALKEFCSNKDNMLNIVISPIEKKSNQKLLDEIKSIKATKNANVSIFEHSTSFVNEIDKITSSEMLKMKGKINFAVGDSKSYRIERFDSPSKYNANCNFNDPKIASLLSNAIKSNLYSCQELVC